MDAAYSSMSQMQPVLKLVGTDLTAVYCSVPNSGQPWPPMTIAWQYSEFPFAIENQGTATQRADHSNRPLRSLAFFWITGLWCVVHRLSICRCNIFSIMNMVVTFQHFNLDCKYVFNCLYLSLIFLWHCLFVWYVRICFLPFAIQAGGTSLTSVGVTLSMAFLTLFLAILNLRYSFLSPSDSLWSAVLDTL